MFKLTLILALAVFIAKTRKVTAQCTYVTDCGTAPSLTTDVDESCTAFEAYVKCLTTASESDDCSDEKTQIDQLASIAQTTMDDELKCGVSGLVSSLTLSVVLSSLSYFLTKFK